MSSRQTAQFDRLTFSTHRWPSVFSCIGRHMLQTSQWKKRSFPPTRQIPHESQWYWDLSSSSKRLQIRHVYFPNRTPHFSQFICTFWRVSHSVQISSSNCFLLNVWVSESSWQKRQLYIFPQHGLCIRIKNNLVLIDHVSIMSCFQKVSLNYWFSQIERKTPLNANKNLFDNVSSDQIQM